MPTPDPSKLIYWTAYNYFRNYKRDSRSLSVPAASHGAGTASNHSVSIPIARAQDFSQVRLNFSFDPTKYYIFPTRGDFVLDANFSLSIVGSYTIDNLTLTVYVVNQSGSTNTNTAFSVTVTSLIFVVPT